MNIVESLLLNFIYVIFPFLIHFLFAIYQKGFGIKQLDILYDLMQISSVYLLVKFGVFTSYWYLLFFQIPLLTAYARGKKSTFIITSIAISLGYFYLYQSVPWILLVEQGGILILFFFSGEKRKSSYLINLFVLIKVLIIAILVYETHSKVEVESSAFIAMGFLVILFVSEKIIMVSRDVIHFYRASERDIEDKNLRESLFKITHEIKNPIAVCKGYLDMFDVKNISHFERYIPILKQEINRTLTIMQDYLDLARLQINKDYFDLGLFMQDISETGEALSNAKKIEFKSDYKDQEIYYYGDYDRLKQVFINLFKNAVESLENRKDGLISFQVDTKLNKIVFYVTDNGQGMSKEALEKIGTPFYSTKKMGTGLGVRFSTEIIELHNGSIEYKSKVNNGTKVIIILPRRKKS